MVETLPDTVPEFGLGYQRGAADPLGGRIGWVIGDPVIAGQLALEKKLPFAICADEMPSAACSFSTVGELFTSAGSG